MREERGDLATEAEVELWRSRTEEICLSFPELVSAQLEASDHTVYKVNDKTVAYYLVNHHNDGRIAIWCKGQPGIQQSLVQSEPVHYFVPPYVGHKGWIGICLSGRGLEPDWEAIEDLLEMSYRMTAKKRQLAILDSV